MVKKTPPQASLLFGSGDIASLRSFASNAVSWNKSFFDDARGQFGTEYDDQTLADAFSISVTAWACTRFRATALSRIPLMVVNEKDEEVKDSPVTWLIKHRTRTLFRIEHALCIFGRYYLRKRRNQFRYPSELEWINPLDLDVNFDPVTKLPVQYRLRANQQIIMPVDMLTDAFFNPNDPSDGLSPFEITMRQVEADRSLVEFAAAFFFNSARPDGILTYEGNLDDDDIEKSKKRWQKTFQGARNAFRTFVSGGLAKWNYQKISSDPAELAMAELKALLRSDVCVAFGVLPALIGIGVANDPLSAQSTDESMRLRFIEDEIVPHSEWLCEALNEQWLHKDFGDFGKCYRIKPDTRQLTSATRSNAARVTTAAQAVAGGLWTVAEGREYTGYDPSAPLLATDPTKPLALYAGGAIKRNELRQLIGFPPQADDGWIYEVDPRNSSTQVSAMPTAQSLPDTDKPISLPPHSEVVQQAGLREIALWRERAKKKGHDVAFRAEYLPDDIATNIRTALAKGDAIADVFSAAQYALRAHGLITEDPSPEAYHSYWKHYDELQHDLGKDWLRYMESVGPILMHAVENQQPITTVLFEKAHDSLVESWLGNLDEPGPMLALVLAGLAAGDSAIKREVAANPQKPTKRALHLGTAWDLLARHAVEFARTYSYNQIKGIDATTIDSVRGVISKGIEEGWGAEQFRAEMLKAIALPGQEVDEALRIRATLIADTESINAYNQGAFQRYREAGVTEAVWQTVKTGLNRDPKKPGDVCPICAPLQGQKASYNAGWLSDRGLTRPGEIHPRCRCFTRPVVS